MLCTEYELGDRMWQNITHNGNLWIFDRLDFQGILFLPLLSPQHLPDTEEYSYHTVWARQSVARTNSMLSEINDFCVAVGNALMELHASLTPIEWEKKFKVKLEWFEDLEMRGITAPVQSDCIFFLRH